MQTASVTGKKPLRATRGKNAIVTGGIAKWSCCLCWRYSHALDVVCLTGDLQQAQCISPLRMAKYFCRKLGFLNLFRAFWHIMGLKRTFLTKVTTVFKFKKFSVRKYFAIRNGEIHCVYCKSPVKLVTSSARLYRQHKQRDHWLFRQWQWRFRHVLHGGASRQ